MNDKFMWLSDTGIYMLRNEYGCMFLKIPSLIDSLFSNHLIIDRYDYDQESMVIWENDHLNRIITGCQRSEIQ